MDARKFFLWNVIGAVIWTDGIFLLGHYLGTSVPNIERYILPGVAVILILSVIPIIREVMKGRREQRENQQRQADQPNQQNRPQQQSESQPDQPSAALVDKPFD
jgi:flagellar biosynthesis/type III secretory pathway M-ring protein FliF/YscJ